LAFFFLSVSPRMSKISFMDFILLPLRLAFGGSACPSEWCVASEIITDLANKILNHEHWDPFSLTAESSIFVPATALLDSSIPFKQARPMIVEPKVERFGKSDVYLDDICLVGVLSDDESERRLKNSILLAMEVVGRPMNKNEPLPRDDLASKSKLLAESGLSEQKCLLGWEFNTRELHIKLSNEKHQTWSSQIKDILDKKGRTTKRSLEVTIGRLNHTASIIPMARHFLSRMYFSLSKMKDFKTYYLPKTVLKDLQLWQKILTKAHNGISLNLLTYREPNKVYWSDACEYGLGGFSTNGKAWRWNIPEHLRDRAHINHRVYGRSSRNLGRHPCRKSSTRGLYLVLWGQYNSNGMDPQIAIQSRKRKRRISRCKAYRSTNTRRPRIRKRLKIV